MNGQLVVQTCARAACRERCWQSKNEDESWCSGVKGHWQEVGGGVSLTSGVIDHEGVHSPRYSLESHTANWGSCWAIQKRRHQQDSLQCSQCSLYLYSCFPSLSLLSSSKKKKWDLLWNGVIQMPWQCFCLWTTRGITYFSREKSWRFWWTQSTSHMLWNIEESTWLLMMSSVNPLPGVLFHIVWEAVKLHSLLFLAPGIFISNCQHDLVLACLACFPFSWDHSLVCVTNSHWKADFYLTQLIVVSILAR